MLDTVGPQRILIDDLNAATGNRAHGVLLVGGHPQLADQHQVQPDLEGRGDFIGHRHPASRQGQDNDVGTLCVSEQRFHQALAGGGTVTQDGLN
ncbi:hypothetical protein D3C72_1817900 [compost metagenome]